MDADDAAQTSGEWFTLNIIWIDWSVGKNLVEDGRLNEGEFLCALHLACKRSKEVGSKPEQLAPLSKSRLSHPHFSDFRWYSNCEIDESQCILYQIFLITSDTHAQWFLLVDMARWTGLDGWFQNPWISTDVQLYFDLKAYPTRHPRSKLFVGNALIPISQRQLLKFVEGEAWNCKWLETLTKCVMVEYEGVTTMFTTHWLHTLTMNEHNGYASRSAPNPWQIAEADGQQGLPCMQSL